MPLGPRFSDVISHMKLTSVLIIKLACTEKSAMGQNFGAYILGVLASKGL